MPEVVAFARLQTLGHEIVKEVDDYLMAGETPSKVATWLQDVKGVLTDLQHGSVKKNLERYRKNVLQKRVVAELKGETKITPAIKKKISALEELESLMLVQKGRLEKVLLQEAKAPLLLKGASDEVRLLKETLVEMGKLQLETGALRRAPKSVSGSMTDPSTGERKEFTWTEEQNELYKQLDNVDYTIEMPARDLTPVEDA